MKTIKTLKNIVLIITLSTNISSFSQTCTGTLAEMTLKNIVVTSTTLEYDVYVKNVGTTTQVRLGGFNGNVVYTPGLLGSGTAILTVIEQPNSPSCNFPTLSNIVPTHTAGSQQMRYTQTIQNFASGNTVIMPLNVDMKLCRFRLTNSVPFDLASVTLRLPNGEDGPSITRNIGTLYCNTNTNASNFAGTLSTLAVGGTYIIDLTTLGTSNSDLESLEFYPNPALTMLNIKNSNVISELTITNLLGQVVRIEKPNASVTQLDLSNLSSNIYFVKIISGEKSKTVKIIKQ